MSADSAVPAMSAAPASTSKASAAGLWLWPAVVMIVAYWTFHFAFQAMEAAPFMRFMTRMGVHALLLFSFLGWWCVNRRVPLLQRLGALAVAIAGGVAATFLIHPSLGIIGVLTTGTAYVATAWVVSLMLLSRAPPTLRWAGWAAAILLTWGSLCAIRMEGLSGEQVAAIHWRWELSAEELFLVQQKDRRRAVPSPSKGAKQAVLRLAAAPGNWVAFRGAQRDGAGPPSEISPDWNAQKPKLVWRQRVGPAWSSLIVVGGRLFTQEQRGPKEAVICYDAATGGELWSHADDARFWDQVSGAGPRATPTFSGGRILTLGGTGILNCLDAAPASRSGLATLSRVPKHRNPFGALPALRW